MNPAQEYSHGNASRLFKSKRHKSKVVVHTCNYNTHEDDAGESLWVRDQAVPHSDFQVNVGHIVTPYLK